MWAGVALRKARLQVRVREGQDAARVRMRGEKMRTYQTSSCVRSAKETLRVGHCYAVADVELERGDVLAQRAKAGAEVDHLPHGCYRLCGSLAR